MLKYVSTSTKGFYGGLSLDQDLQERHGSDFFLLITPAYTLEEVAIYSFCRTR